ncbi:ANL family adenylate-forming protein [Phenylobacterium montanum]|uniref:Long-chain-fatty-acid--CoA ligase n=1 Tax=Phenylobacterium montanum TaxID=2823693 RepID=A0A975FZC9_9CAUL|nr:fatty acid--CoA ligase family protein [Caulobacter sp. S6]QUD88235.1 long-chain fatty acid--CoA ligase [Caulobacter sp. S6]
MTSLREGLAAAPGKAGLSLHGRERSLAFEDLAARTGLGAARAGLAGRSVLIHTRSQIGAAQAMVELDGLAQRIVVCPPDLADEHLPSVVEHSGAEAIVVDGEHEPLKALGLPIHRLAAPAEPAAPLPSPTRPTEWLLFTSGTTGAPKMVIHKLDGLTGAIKPRPAGAPPVVWGTFYDIRRYGGLQILLRALTGPSAIVLSDPDEPTPAFLARLGEIGVTHQTGTPSHWRWALMNPELKLIDPAYVRLSGEIADQAVLDGLAAFFPKAAVGHAYASTEAGVGFEVNDGLEGFPAAYVGAPGAEVEMQVVDGVLLIRSKRTASGYAGIDLALVRPDGFVDTGDMVELRGDRYYFMGRRGGIINVGGLKVNPEEVEAVINRQPGVRMALVKARKNPITGSVVAAEVVRSGELAEIPDPDLKAQILEGCREALPAYKVPVNLKFVPSLPVTAGGKLDRNRA